MLLSSLSILMGAILVPSDYLWAYSTHIIIMCLYLIWTKRLIVFFLTLLSLLSVFFHEFNSPEPFPVFDGAIVWVDFDDRKLTFPEPLLTKLQGAIQGQSIAITYQTANGNWHSQDNFTLREFAPHTSNQHDSLLYKGRTARLVIPAKEGAWWQRQLYVKRQAAQITVEFADGEIERLDNSPYNVRDKLTNRLDSALQSYDSWRFSKALLLGQNDLWSEKNTWVIRTLGLAHLFVVSGLHTGFMFVIGRLISRVIWLLLPAKMLLSGLTRWHCDAAIVIPMLFGYAYITNWGEPVVRASIMLSVYLCARMLALKASPHGIIIFALWLILLVEPRSILSPGLWLSFSMVFLLIGYCQTTVKLSRLLMVQLMLSTASMVLILGWQEAISSVSILTNVVLIPFAAFVWFPWGIAACVEVVVVGTDLSYSILDVILRLIIGGVDWLAFELPLLPFEQYASSAPRLLMLFLIGFWVYQSPLKRGLLCVVGIWSALFASAFIEENGANLTIFNSDGRLMVKDKSTVLMVDSWAAHDLNRLLFDGYVMPAQNRVYLLSPADMTAMTPEQLLSLNVSWVVLRKYASTQIMAMMTALKVDWVIVEDHESLSFFFENDRTVLRHSACIYSFFLLKSDTCKRVEKLESVLNYIQT